MLDLQAWSLRELLIAREYLQSKVANPILVKGESEGHEFRGNRYTGGISSGGPQVYVRADAATPGTASYDIQARQPGGAPIRGTVIAPTDPRIPSEVYHVTTHYNEVVQSGVLKAGGAGGLGGDDRDHIVSMTISKDVADDIEHDQKLMATWAQSVPIEPPGQQWDEANSKWLPAPEREAWGKQLTSNMQESARQEGWDFKPVNAFGEYSFGDWQVQYFTARESAIGKQNPVFFGAKHSDWASIDPKNIGTIRISKESLNNGALLTNFDLGQHGLEEIRSYGDIVIGSQKVATITKGEGPGHEFINKWAEKPSPMVWMIPRQCPVCKKTLTLLVHHSPQSRNANEESGLQLASHIQQRHHLTKRSAISKAIEAVRSLPKEHATVFNAEGKRVWDKDGGHDFVALKELEHKDLEGATFIHNHPSGVAPSVDDIGSACALQLGCVYAVGKNGLTYSVSPPLGKKTFEPEMWNKIRNTGMAADGAVREAFSKAITNGDISVDDANRDHWHMVNTIVALRTGVQYKRTGKGEYHLEEIMAAHKGHVPVYDKHGVSNGYPPPEALSKEADVTFSLLHQKQEAQPKIEPSTTNADSDTRR